MTCSNVLANTWKTQTHTQTPVHVCVCVCVCLKYAQIAGDKLEQGNLLLLATPNNHSHQHHSWIMNLTWTHNEYKTNLYTVITI